MSTATAANPFSRKATSSSGGGDYEMPPGGSYPCVLVSIIDMGTHDEEYNGETKPRRKIFLCWELTAENNSKGETFKVGKEFPFPDKLSSKNPLRKLLEGWQGKTFTDDEDIDPTRWMNQPGVINLTEGTSAKGKKFVNIASVTRPMKGLTVPPATVELLVWGFDGWNANDEPPIPDWMPFSYGKKVSDVVKASAEWKKLSPF